MDIKTDNESTPLMLAAHHGNLKIVKLLVTEGADINAQDDDGNTSLHLAINRKTGPALLLEMVSNHKVSIGISFKKHNWRLLCDPIKLRIAWPIKLQQFFYHLLTFS